MKTTKKLYLSLMLAVLGLQACEKTGVVELELITPKKSWTDTVEVNKFEIGVNGQDKLNWNWNNPDQNSIAVNYRNISGGTVSRDITLPWKTQGNILCVPNPDIKTEDGWDVVLINFGTTEKPIDMPFFLIYNKKTSLLRCFIYNSQRIAANDFVGKLIYHGTNFDHLSLVSQIKTYKTKASTLDAWINLEFGVTQNKLEQLLKTDKFGIDVRCFMYTYYNFDK